MTSSSLELDFHRSLSEALELLQDHKGAFVGNHPSDAQHVASALPSLIERCREAVAKADSQSRPPVRMLHHLACTGGTLVSRCLACQPNVQLLSEVDPLTTLPYSRPFVPTDMIGLAKLGSRPPSTDVLIEIFMAGLGALYADSRLRGRYLVLRDHTHSHFNVGPDIPTRQTLRDMVRKQYPVRSIVTVRHPLDSFLSLRKNGWKHFSPFTLEEYAVRYHAFLDCYSDVELFRYEDFVAEPKDRTAQMCEVLQIPYNPDFLDVFSAIKLSGDSGRSGNTISARPRQANGQDLLDEAMTSKSFASLLERLNYQLITQ
ncbi:sulfotransferase [Rhizobium sp. GN54]|uniref:sulfotransferase n=1 Tax=Rhizobium sp. GN54 TaxID=2898150 RepID=UPI001E2EE106|nr:sulfotransferase [Rhizobium sp. GN54]MCD2183564.1 sulfotransferase [Rhizobium sp. GN54]